MKKQLINLMSQRSQRRVAYVDKAIRQFPHLKAHIEAWPQLVNSLVDTGRTNELHVAGGAYINSEVMFGPGTIDGFRFCITGAYSFTPYVWNLHGCSDSHNSCCIGLSPSRHLAIGNGDSVSELVHRPELVGHTHIYDLQFAPNGAKATFSVGTPGQEGYSYVAAVAAVAPSSARSLHLFHCNGQGSTFGGWLRDVLITVGGTEHRFVPYIQDGHCGLLDLTTLAFHGNASTSGILTIMDVPASATH